MNKEKFELFLYFFFIIIILIFFVFVFSLNFRDIIQERDIYSSSKEGEDIFILAFLYILNILFYFHFHLYILDILLFSFYV